MKPLCVGKRKQDTAKIRNRGFEWCFRNLFYDDEKIYCIVRNFCLFTFYLYTFTEHIPGYGIKVK
jgi:hypothetical protein